MFEEKNNQPQSSQPRPLQNAPTSNNVSDEEKKIFGEDRGNFSTPSKPSFNVPREFLVKKKKSPLLLILVIIIFIIIVIVLTQSSVFKLSSVKLPTILNTSTNQPVTPQVQTPIAPVANQIIDTDGDGLTDEQEITLGTNIQSTDSDNDGLFDFEEVKIYKTDPLNADTDADGYKDGEEVRAGYNPKDPAPKAKLLDLLKEIEKEKNQ